MLSFSFPKWLATACRRWPLPKNSRRRRITRPGIQIERLEDRRMLTEFLDLPGQIAADYPAGSTPVCVATADIDHDGAVDIITVNSGGVSVLRNRGDSSYTAPVTYPVGSSPSSVIAADLDGDSWPDLVTTNRNDGNVSVLLNLGNGTFAAALTYSVLNAPSAVTAADLNGDGVLDLAVSNSQSAFISILLNQGDGTFATRANYAMISGANSIITADVDGDGALDVITANSNSNNVSVLRNLGDGTFSADVKYPVGLTPRSVAAGDFNHDGFVDLVTANRDDDTVSVLRNLGDGTFATQVKYGAGDGPSSVKVVDVDADGFVDLVTASSTVSVLRNLGNGTFAPQVNHAVAGANSVEAADLDGDQDPDLVVSNEYAFSVSVLHNLGGGLFEAPIRDTYQVGGTPRAVTTADVNGDGHLDIVSTDANTNTVSVLRNLGDDTFADDVAYPVGNNPYAVLAGDFDLDGAIDLVTANNSNGSLSVLRNLGDGTFATHVTYTVGTGPRSVTAADFDGDGSLDLAAANLNSSSVSVLLNAGDGTFLAQTTYAAGGVPTLIRAIDYDHDGAIDLVTANTFGNMSVLRNLGDGTFADAQVSTLESNFLATADVDGDGSNDLITPNYYGDSVGVSLNLGNGTFADSIAYVVEGGPAASTTADLNGDGAVDIIAVSQAIGTCTILWNLGDGTFTSRMTYAVGNSPRSMTAADVDKDGDVDLISANAGSGTLSVLRNLGNGTFATPAYFGAGETYFVTSADLDLDGAIDLVTAAFGGAVAILKNQGTGTFDAAFGLTAGSHPTGVITADIDGDTDPDVISVSEDAVVSVIRNLGSMSFSPQVTYPVGSQSYFVTAADIDDDGAVDVITANRSTNGTVSILRNLGNGTFAAAITIPAGNATQYLAVADVDRDGKLDIVTANAGSNSVSVLRNLGNLTFAAEVTYPVGYNPLSITTTDFDFDGAVDLVTANNRANNNRGTVSVLRNRGDGTFEPHLTYKVSDRPVAVIATDLDNDGDVDLATANNNLGLGSIVVLLNQADGSSAMVPDLQVTSVTVQPDPVVLGGTLHIEYTGSNSGPLPAEGRWIDSVFLSRDDHFDPSDHLLSRITHQGPLASGANYNETLDIGLEAFAGFTPGEWFVLVRTDAGGDIAEQSNSNNVGAVACTINQSLTTLTLGETFTGTLSAGEERYFQINYSAGDLTVFVLDGLPTNGTVEIYIKQSGLPTGSIFDYSSTRPFAAEQYLLAPPQVASGTFYILVHAATLATSSTSFNLTASVPEFGVRTTRFGTAGNAGDYTLRALGARFDNSITVRLKNGLGFDLPAKGYSRDSDNTLFATFDLRGVTPGEYDVVFTNGDSDVVAVPRSLTVVAASTPDAVVPKIIAPASIRRGREFSFVVEWVNTSLNDVIVPLLTIGSTSPFGLTHKDYSLGTSYTFLGTNTHGGPAGILRPGQRETMTFWSFSDLEPGTYTVFADRTLDDASTVFDWQAAIETVQPAIMSDADAVSVAHSLEMTYGANADGYLRMLSAAANATWGDARNSNQLLQEEVLRAWSRLSSGIWGIVNGIEGVPEGGVFVTARETSSGNPFVTRTDRLGRFHLSNLPNGTFQLSIQDYSIVAPGSTAVEIVAGLSVGPIDVSVTPAHRTQIQIDMLDGDPVANAAAVLLKDGDRIALAQTNPAGVALFFGVAPGTYTLVVSLPEGGLRQYQGVVIPGETETIQIDLASATLQGLLPESTNLYPVLVPTTAVMQVIHPEISGQAFQLVASEGEYRLLLFDVGGNLDQEVGTFVLNNGAVVDVGQLVTSNNTGFVMAAAASEASEDDVWFDDPIVGLGVHMVDGPPSFLAYIDITVLGLRDPDLVEALVAPFVIWGTELVRGSEYAEVVTQYVAGGGTALFTDGSQTIEERIGVNPGFRNHPKTQEWLHRILVIAATNLEQAVSSGDIVLECGESQVFDLRDLRTIRPADEEAERVLYQDGNMPEAQRWLAFGNTLAGGVGHYGTPTEEDIGHGPPFTYRTTPDWRQVDEGKVRITKDHEGNYTVQLEGVKLHVRDAFDLWPGSLGEPWLTRYGTTVLAYLEINGRAADVVFDAIWTDREVRQAVLGIQGEPCDDLCDGPHPPDNCDDILRPASSDPNDITGPAGVGPLNHIVDETVMPYTIRFENDKETATAPAATVTITQTLDSDLDWTTFRLGDMGFGDTIVEVPADAAFFQTQVDLTSTRGVLVDITAGINIATGEVHWEFTAIDPATGDLPENPLVGFLPPNVNGPEGEGFVNYTVLQKPGLTTGDRIDGVASIVFDVNAAILTPAIFHTIDSGTPVSQVLSLPSVTDVLTFTVSWEGTDDTGGAGIENYDVFVSDNGGDYVLFLDNATTTSAEFTGQSNHTYAFYSVATDLLGHREASPSVADTQTTIAVVGPPDLAITSQEISWHAGQPPVAVLPDIVVNGQDLTGGVLRLDTTAVGSRKKAKDLFAFGTLPPWGTSSGPTFANGHIQVAIQLNSAATAPLIQAFLRSITFATKGKGTKVPTRNLTVLLENASGQAASVSRTLRVAGIKGRAFPNTTHLRKLFALSKE